MIIKIHIAGTHAGNQVQLNSTQVVLPDWPDYIQVEGEGQYKKVGLSFSNPKSGYQVCDYEPTQDKANYVSVPRQCLGGFLTSTKQKPPKACPLHGLQFALEELQNQNGFFLGCYL